MHITPSSAAPDRSAYWGNDAEGMPKKVRSVRDLLERIVRPSFADDENPQSRPTLLPQWLELEIDPTEPEGSAKNLRKPQKTLPAEAQCLA
mgnify:CR=1 FL=1